MSNSEEQILLELCKKYKRPCSYTERVKYESILKMSEEEMKLVRILAAECDPEAQFKYAVLLYFGHGNTLLQNKQLAIKYLQYSYSQGHVLAGYTLAVCMKYKLVENISCMSELEKEHLRHMNSHMTDAVERKNKENWENIFADISKKGFSRAWLHRQYIPTIEEISSSEDFQNEHQYLHILKRECKLWFDIPKIIARQSDTPEHKLLTACSLLYIDPKPENREQALSLLHSCENCFDIVPKILENPESQKEWFLWVYTVSAYVLYGTSDTFYFVPYFLYRHENQ